MTVAGDVDFDGVPDVLAPAADGSLTLYRGGAGAAAGPETASPADRSPRQDDWNNYLLANRGPVIGHPGSLLAYHKSEKQLYVYLNDAGAFPNPVPGHFARTSLQLGTSDICSRGIDGTWKHIVRMTAVQRGTGRPHLVTVEKGHLRYYPASLSVNCGFDAGVELGAEGGDWSGFTPMYPGEVNGVPTLWVRDDVTGAVADFPLSMDAEGRPVSGFTPLTPPARKPLVSGLRGAGGESLCADVDQGRTANGTAALLATCTDQGAGAGQAFSRGTDGTLHVLGKCLDVPGAARDNGTALALWDCNSTAAQKWEPGPAPSTLRNPNSGKCLTVAGGVGTPGTRLTIQDCLQGPGQTWQAPDAQPALPLGLGSAAHPAVDAPGDINTDGNPDLVATAADGRLFWYPGAAPEGSRPRFGEPQELAVRYSAGYSIGSGYVPGRCLDNWGAGDGTRLRLYDCWNGPSQRFAFASDGTLRTGGRCVSVQDDRTDWGAPVVVANCRAGSGQIWTHRADGTLHNPASGTCLELPGWESANGTALGIWQCHGNANQRWTLSPNTA
ncbi:RICIN domain-containing protein [Kitasatospora sp. NPDC004240]